MSKTSITEPIVDAPRSSAAADRRRDLRAGVAAVGAVAASFAALLILVGTEPAAQEGATSRRTLDQAADDPGSLWAAAGLRSLGLLFTIVVAVRVLQLTRDRRPLPRWPLIVGVVAPLALVGATLVGQVAIGDAADAWTSSGPRTESRASDLLQDGALQTTASAWAVAATLVFAVWLGWTALALGRVGLTTTFLGYFGVGAAAASVVLPVAGQGMVIGWIGSVGLLLLGWWPGGRGPSWSTGEPVPWTANDAMTARQGTGT